MTTPAPARCLASFALDDAPANEVFPADLDGDGRLELLCWQSPGIYQSRLFNPGSPFWDQPYGDGARTRRTDACLTALTADGRRLWQYGLPKAYADGIECMTHVPDQMVWCEDLDGDGKPEVALIHGRRLLLLEGASGRILREAELESDNVGIVRAARTRAGARLLVKNTEAAYPPAWYGDPALLYDAELRLVARLPRTVGSGHSPRAADIDGDGDEEWLIGYEAYRADGRRLWRLDAVDESAYDPAAHHVDQLQLGRFGPGRAPGIVYAGSTMAYGADLSGRCLWRLNLGHPQHVVAGQFTPSRDYRQLAILGNLGHNVIFLLRDDGKLMDVLTFGLRWPELPGCARKPHSGEGFLLYPGGCENGCDALVLRDWGWPRLVNARGEDVCLIPEPEPDASPARGRPPRMDEETARMAADGLIPDAPLCPRESYGVRVCDMDGDGRNEIVIHNLRRLWIFQPPRPGPADPRLRPVTGQGTFQLDA